MSLLALAGTAALWLAQARPPTAVDVSLELSQPMHCPDEASVAEALRVRLGIVPMGKPSGRGLALRLVPKGSTGATIALHKAGALVAERTIEVRQEECTALAHTVALIVESWLAPPVAPAHALPVRIARRARASVDQAQAEVEAPGEPEAMASRELETAKASAQEASPPEDDRDTASSPRDDVSRGGVAVPTPAPPPSQLPMPDVIAAPTPLATAPSGAGAGRTWSASVGAGAGLAAGLASSAAPVATASADLTVGRGRWLLGLRAAAETAADLDPSSAEVVLRHVPVCAYLGRALIDHGRLSLAAQVGGGIDFVFAHTSGYASDRSFALAVPTVLAGARGEWRIGRRLGIVAVTDALVAVRRVELVVTNLGTAASAPRVRGAMTVGMVWHLQ